MEEYLDAIYIGKDTSDEKFSAHPHGRYYKTLVRINDRVITIYFVIEMQKGYTEYNCDEIVPTMIVLGWYDLNDRIYGERFAEMNFDKLYSDSHPEYDFEHDDDETPCKIDLFDVQVPVPNDYIPLATDSPFFQYYNSVTAQVCKLIFDRKKKLFLEKRMKKFMSKLKKYEEEYPDVKLDNILKKLKKAEKEETVNLHKTIVQCVLLGKYSFNNYLIFMKNIVSLIRHKEILITRKKQDEISTKEDIILTDTYEVPSNELIAGLRPRKIDIDNGYTIKQYKDRILSLEFSFEHFDTFKLKKLDEKEKGSYWSPSTIRDKEEAIGKIGKFIVCTGNKYEFTLVPISDIKYYKK